MVTKKLHTDMCLIYTLCTRNFYASVISELIYLYESNETYSILIHCVAHVTDVKVGVGHTILKKFM